MKLRILLTDNRLAYELDTGGGIAPRAEIPYAAAEIAALQRSRLALVSREQGGGAGIEKEFLNTGRQLGEILLPAAIRESLRHTVSRPLSLVLDPQLIGIAWESLVIGEGLLCMTRPVARRILLEVPARPPRRPGQRFLIVANPSGDLASAQEHGESLFEQLTEEFGLPQVTFLANRRATQRGVCAALERCDALIYLGHAAHDPAAPRQSGWRLADGMLDVERLAGLASVPALVVAAACESARETPATAGFSLLPEGTGVAAGLMLAGVEQYVGALWRMPVVSGTAFGAVLLRALLDGAAMGDAMMTAREHLREVLCAPGYVCAGQIHYGDHDWRLRR